MFVSVRLFWSSQV